MHDDEMPLRRLAAEHGVFLRREALELGLDDKVIRREVRAGRWVRVRHGAYHFADVWKAASPEAQHVIATRAVLRTGGDRVAASHHSAALLHGLELWGTPLDKVHVTRLDGGAGRTERDVVHHEGLWLPRDLAAVEGVRATAPVRAALESAALTGVERGLVVVESGLRQGTFTAEDVAEQHRLMEHWPGTRHLHLVTRLADRRSESVGESRCGFLFWSQGLPMPDRQFEVYDGDRLVGVTDFAWPELGLLGEFDGRVKYGRHLRPGEEPGDAVFREKRREDLLRRLTGWSMVRLTWADLYYPERTAALIRSMMARVA